MHTSILYYLLLYKGYTINNGGRKAPSTIYGYTLCMRIAINRVRAWAADNLTSLDIIFYLDLLYRVIQLA